MAKNLEKVMCNNLIDIFIIFQIADYTLSRDVKSSLKRQVTYEKQFQDHALLILNGFGNKGRNSDVFLSAME